jgi:hypothetical protein
MIRPRAVLAALALPALACLPACGGSADGAPGETTAQVAPAATDTLCADSASWNQLCSTIPHEVQVSLPFGYDGLSPKVQPHFDNFSWQSFVALNWPGRAQQALPVALTDSLGAPRVWETYQAAADLFWGSAADGPCNPTGGGKVLFQFAKNGHVVNAGGSFDEAVGGPLVDRNLNFVVFEKKMNPDEVAYVTTHNLTTVAGQAAADTIDFPAGSYADTANRVGAIELKASWRILQPEKGDDTTRYYHRRATIYVPAENSASGQAMCIPALVGLVGLHILHKTETFPQWIWSTFEHVDNVPVCSDTVTSGDQCGVGNVRWSFFNPSCPNCVRNDSLRLPSGQSTFQWASAMPYAAAYATAGQFGAQLVRPDPIYPPTDSVNRVWHKALQGTVWANYQLIGSQWLSGSDSEGGKGTAAPVHLGNSTLESFFRPDTPSCLGCHAFARTSNPDPSLRKFADFSFLLGMAGEKPTAIQSAQPREQAERSRVRR